MGDYRREQERSTVLYDVTVEDGKYRFVYHMDAKPPEAYRHGEPWEAGTAMLLGNKSIMALVSRIDELENGR